MTPRKTHLSRLTAVLAKDFDEPGHFGKTFVAGEMNGVVVVAAAGWSVLAAELDELVRKHGGSIEYKKQEGRPVDNAKGAP